MGRAATLVVGVLAGAAGAWFMDPNDGKRRRNLARDKALKHARRGAAQASGSVTQAAQTARGKAYEAAPVGGRADAGERLNDPALARKVESEIFRNVDAPKGAVAINVEDGVVWLRGQVEEDMIERLAEEAGKVEGVKGVENLLHTPGTAAPHH